MRYLIIDNLNNYFLNELSERKKSDCFTSIIMSYINNTINNRAELINASEGDIIFNSPDDIEYEAFIIRINEDNINSALRLKASINQKTFFLSVNENLNQYFSNEMRKFYINFNEREKLNVNIEKINKLLDIDPVKTTNIDSIKKCSIDYTRKYMNVNIGSGCDRQCAFCSISGTNINYYPLKSMIMEIKNNLENGIKSFHINNHNFTSNLKYVREFCNLLINECGHLDFKWSCFIIPENIIQDIDILYLLKNAKLDRIELGVENINKSILMDFNLSIQENDIIKIIDTSNFAKISSIAINYIIGSPNESEETLQKTKEFLEMLILKTSGKLDLNLSFLYPDIDTKYNNYQTLQERWFIINKCIKRKQSCLLNTNYLSKMNIYSWKWNFIKQINNERLQFISKLTPKERINICILSEYGIKNQIEKHFLNTSITHLFSQKRLFDKRNARKISFFFEEIETCIESYTPRLVSENHVFVDSSNSMFIKPDQLFVINKNSSPINISEFDLYKSMLSELSICDIFAINCKNGNDDKTIKNSIIKRLKELENVHLIYYIQILN